MNNDESKTKNEDGEILEENSQTEKLKFGSLTPLSAAQVVTLLVGASGSSSSYGGY